MPSGEGHQEPVGPSKNRDRYHGEAEFGVTRDQANDWRLIRWLDRRSASDPDTTWGILKGRHRLLAVE